MYRVNPQTRAVGNNLAVCKGFAVAGAPALFPARAKETLPHQGWFALGAVVVEVVHGLCHQQPPRGPGAGMGRARHRSQQGTVLTSGLVCVAQRGHSGAGAGARPAGGLGVQTCLSSSA